MSFTDELPRHLASASAARWTQVGSAPALSYRFPLISVRITMDKLPQESICRIVLFTERCLDQKGWSATIGEPFGLAKSPSQCPRLAHLNGFFPEAVETTTFHDLLVKSDELDVLQAIATGNRRKNVPKIRFTVRLPEYSDEACARRESRDE
jgi:hypothetical protein